MQRLLNVITEIVLPGMRKPIIKSIRTLFAGKYPEIALIIPRGKIKSSDIAKDKNTDHTGIEKFVILFFKYYNLTILPQFALEDRRIEKSNIDHQKNQDSSSSVHCEHLIQLVYCRFG